MDFTFKSYTDLLKSFLLHNWNLVTQESYSLILQQSIIIRHDVDRAPNNALAMAKLEAGFGIKASYYFRFVPESYDEKIITEIASMGHEIGYHYENISKINELKTIKNDDELFKLALEDFEKNLLQLRKLYPVKTMCMHGSPMSKWDNRELWKKNDYKKYGIICEPYFDIDFDKVFYITDASRAWNNEKVSVRDKVESKYNIPINSTDDIINLLKSGNAPNQIMINIHPHNWAKNNAEWFKIWVWQGFKNIIKRQIIIFRKAL